MLGFADICYNFSTNSYKIFTNTHLKMFTFL